MVRAMGMLDGHAIRAKGFPERTWYSRPSPRETFMAAGRSPRFRRAKRQLGIIGRLHLVILLLACVASPSYVGRDRRFYRLSGQAKSCVEWHHYGART